MLSRSWRNTLEITCYTPDRKIITNTWKHYQPVIGLIGLLIPSVNFKPQFHYRVMNLLLFIQHSSHIVMLYSRLAGYSLDTFGNEHTALNKEDAHISVYQGIGPDF